jgi:hypothetical protein
MDENVNFVIMLVPKFAKKVKNDLKQCGNDRGKLESKKWVCQYSHIINHITLI